MIVRKKTITVLMGLLVWALMMGTWAQAQVESPMDIEIGKPLPEMVLTDIQHYHKDRVSTKEFMGKPFILFFWGRFCSSAFKYLSVMDGLAREYGDRMEVLVVAGRAASYLEGENAAEEPEALRTLFERARKLQDLRLPITYGLDLFERVVPRGVPHLILVDEKGIVKAVTADLNEGKVESFLRGETFSYNDYSKGGQLEEEQRIDAYDYNKLFMVDNNGGRSDGFQFRSLITPYTDDMPMGNMLINNLDRFGRWNKIEGFGGLKELYQLAYYGKYDDVTEALSWERYPMLVLEVADSSPFVDNRYNKPKKHMYWYSLVVPERLGNPNSLMKIMQHDLEDFFGYGASVTKRKLPYWKITLPIAARKALKSKGGEEEMETDRYTMMGVTHMPVEQFLGKMLYMFSLKGYQGMPIRDYTGGGLHIDVPVQDVDLSDFVAVKKVLEGLGFRIEKAYGEFDALVIRDSQSDFGNYGR